MTIIDIPFEDLLDADDTPSSCAFGRERGPTAVDDVGDFVSHDSSTEKLRRGREGRYLGTDSQCMDRKPHNVSAPVWRREAPLPRTHEPTTGSDRFLVSAGSAADPRVTVSYDAQPLPGLTGQPPFLAHGSVPACAIPPLVDERGADEALLNASVVDDLSARTVTAELQPLEAPDYEHALAIYEWECAP